MGALAATCLLEGEGIIVNAAGDAHDTSSDTVVGDCRMDFAAGYLVLFSYTNKRSSI